MPDQTGNARDPRDIYYQCTGCGREAISFDKPFPEYCAECKVVRMIETTEPHSAEPPCIGLDPDTDPCPICGTWLSDDCKWKAATPDYLSATREVQGR